MENQELQPTQSQVAPAPPKNPIKMLFDGNGIKQKFQELLGEKAQGFTTSVLQVCMNNKLLAKSNPMTVYNAACIAATLDLPINNNLGFAWIVPYNGEAQFQMGWKGFVQLALRTSQYKAINVVEVYENQFKSYNALTEELIADFSKDGEGSVVGYCGYFRLVNGFEKTVYWTKEKVLKHANKYSQAFKKKDSVSPWNDEDQFDSMAKKTVLKNMLAKWGILSIEMNKAIQADQGVINNEDATDVTYIDNEDAITFEDVECLYKERGEFLSPDDQLHAERIIKEREDKSYSKLHRMLMEL